MAKRKSKKIVGDLMNPDKNLTERQIYKLNKEFYENYYTDYFATKLYVLGSMFSNSDNFLKVINNNDIEVGVFKIESSNINGERDDICKFVKLELSVLYYHCIETFLRLFIAHSELKQCPWLELSRDTDYSNFKSKIIKFSKGEFSFNFKDLSSDQIITYVLYGVEDVVEIGLPANITKEKAIEILKDWIIWSAKELISVYDYNSYKHGLTVYSKPNGFTLSSQDQRKIEEYGDCLTFLSKVKKDQRFKWEKKIVFTPLDYRSAIVHILQGFIQNIINIGKRTYLGEENKLEVQFVGSKSSVFYDMVKTENPFGVSVQSYSVGLEYIKED